MLLILNHRLNLRSLRIHPPRLCCFAVFEAKCTVMGGQHTHENPFFLFLQDRRLQLSPASLSASFSRQKENLLWCCHCHIAAIAGPTCLIAHLLTPHDRAFSLEYKPTFFSISNTAMRISTNFVQNANCEFRPQSHFGRNWTKFAFSKLRGLSIQQTFSLLKPTPSFSLESISRVCLLEVFIW